MASTMRAIAVSDSVTVAALGGSIRLGPEGDPAQAVAAHPSLKLAAAFRWWVRGRLGKQFAEDFNW